ncbi:MAG: M23 family metallopeptidase [Bacteroidales bacterium]|nr:M23 family metallopeptidase [Bacteroidales bacterium]
MKQLLPVFLLMVIAFTGCKKDTNTQPYPDARIEVVLNEIPFTTETNLRIGYALKTWEYEKDGLKLVTIIVMNQNNTELAQYQAGDFRRIYKNPITPSPFFQWSTLDSYYISIQLPIDLNATPPASLNHQLVFEDTIQNKEVILKGGSFTPRYSESPLIIASPVKGERLLFINQSTSLYHFDALIFLNDEVYGPERFAFDNVQYNNTYTDIYTGDPTVNTSYDIYGDTIYAVAAGTIEKVTDGRPENHGNQADVVFHSANEYAGNYLIQKIGTDRYAYYCHIIPGKIFVSAGDQVTEGQPLALLGNSGNSTAPHLHFHVADGVEFWTSHGIPIVLKKYTKTGDAFTGPVSPYEVQNAMMEETTMVTIDN